MHVCEETTHLRLKNPHDIIVYLEQRHDHAPWSINSGFCHEEDGDVRVSLMGEICYRAKIKDIYIKIGGISL